MRGPGWRPHPTGPTRRRQRQLAQALPDTSVKGQSQSSRTGRHSREPAGSTKRGLATKEEHSSGSTHQELLRLTGSAPGPRVSAPNRRASRNMIHVASGLLHRTRKRLTSTWLGVSNKDLVCVEEFEEGCNDAVSVLWHLVDAGRCELHQWHGVGPQLQTLLHASIQQSLSPGTLWNHIPQRREAAFWSPLSAF